MLRRFSVKLPQVYLQEIEALIEQGCYISTTEAMRIAIRDFIWKYSKK
ncbi:MAG: ribbon-helix-helix domain-containing protein [Candidatus Helarchaeota archaeon]